MVPSAGMPATGPSSTAMTGRRTGNAWRRPGKTTLLNCLAAAIPASERVVTVEEVFELQVPLPDAVGLQTRQPSLEGTGEIQLRRLVKEALRMRPSRIMG